MTGTSVDLFFEFLMAMVCLLTIFAQSPIAQSVNGFPKVIVSSISYRMLAQIVDFRKERMATIGAVVAGAAVDSSVHETQQQWLILDSVS